MNAFVKHALTIVTGRYYTLFHGQDHTKIRISCLVVMGVITLLVTTSVTIVIRE